jgi:alpha-D-xyloside xylohydrolase
MTGQVHLDAGEQYVFSIRGNNVAGLNFSIGLRTPDYPFLRLHSLKGPFVDYYITVGAGGSLDGAIQGYRQITGVAPLYGAWVYGFWQCKVRCGAGQGVV